MFRKYLLTFLLFCGVFYGLALQSETKNCSGECVDNKQLYLRAFLKTKIGMAGHTLHKYLPSVPTSMATEYVNSDVYVYYDVGDRLAAACGRTDNTSAIRFQHSQETNGYLFFSVTNSTNDNLVELVVGMELTELDHKTIFSCVNAENERKTIYLRLNDPNYRKLLPTIRKTEERFDCKGTPLMVTSDGKLYLFDEYHIRPTTYWLLCFDYKSIRKELADNKYFQLYSRENMRYYYYVSNNKKNKPFPIHDYVLMNNGTASTPITTTNVKPTTKAPQSTSTENTSSKDGTNSLKDVSSEVMETTTEDLSKNIDVTANNQCHNETVWIIVCSILGVCVVTLAGVVVRQRLVAQRKEQLRTRPPFPLPPEATEGHSENVYNTVYDHWLTPPPRHVSP